LVSLVGTKLTMFKPFRELLIIEERAQKEKGELSIKECPVCGANSVIRETDYNPDSETQWVSTLNCICYSFEIDSELSEVCLEELDTKKYWQLN